MAGGSINVVGTGYQKSDWGIPQEQFGFVATTSVSITNTTNIVEAKNRVGEVVAAVVYDKRAEVSVEGVGEATGTKIGGNLSLTGVSSHLQTSSQKVICTEIAVELSNEDWIKTTVKGNVYDLIN